MSHLMNTYARLPVAFVSGQGSYLTDSNGKQYLDALTGLAVVGVGHANEAVANAIDHIKANREARPAAQS